LAVELDCDGDALRFTVHQHGTGFCHTGTRSCWDAGFTFGSLERIIVDRIERPEPGSGTNRVLDDPDLLAAKLVEEAAELASASDADEAVHETADLLYFALVRLRRAGGSLAEVEAELQRRHGRVRRRAMDAKVTP
jgi:phosphoribosyl-ATP pyrophosphohydrolase